MPGGIFRRNSAMATERADVNDHGGSHATLLARNAEVLATMDEARREIPDDIPNDSALFRYFAGWVHMTPITSP